MDYRKTLRTLFIYGVIPAICAGGPVAWFSGSQWWSSLTASLATGPSAAQDQPSGTTSPTSLFADQTSTGTPASPAETAAAPGLAKPSPVTAAGPPIHPMPEVFRFDISPRWIADHWPRVSTALAQLQLQGYRVPLVTGPAEDDLAGSLTYYFNPWQQLQRITFVGTTGDVRRLVTFMTSQYGFARRLTNDPGQFLYEVPSADGAPRGILWIRHFPVLKTDQPRQRYEVNLTLDRPG